MAEELQQVTPDEIAKQYRKVLAAALKLTQDEDDAKDLTQDVMIHAIKKRHQFEPGTSLMAWLATMTKNLFINQYRRNLKWANPVDLSEAANWVGTPETVYQDLEKEHLDAALQTIPEVMRRCLDLRRQGYSYEDTAELEGIPVGTVRSRIFRGRNELEIALKTTTQPMSSKSNRVDYQVILNTIIMMLDGATAESPVILKAGELARETGVSDLTATYCLQVLSGPYLQRRRVAKTPSLFEYWFTPIFREVTADQLKNMVAKKAKESVKPKIEIQKPDVAPVHPFAEKKPVEKKVHEVPTHLLEDKPQPAVFGYFVDGAFRWHFSKEDAISEATKASKETGEVLIVQMLGKVVAQPVLTLY